MWEYVIGAAIVIAIALVFLYFTYYNRIRVLENQIDEAWAQIDVQLKKRFDLVPNLVETVKGYAAHEKAVFENIANASTPIRMIKRWLFIRVGGGAAGS